MNVTGACIVIPRRHATTRSSCASWRVPCGAEYGTQPGSPPVIGFLNGASADGYAHYVSEFHAGLKQTGYVEGQNVLVLYRWAEGQYDRLPGLAADLVKEDD